MTWARPNFSEYDALCWFANYQIARSTGSGHEFGIFTSGGHFVGGCGLAQFSVANKLCGLGYWVRQSAQRRGAATAATIALRALALQSLGQARVEIAVANGNEPSLGVARRAGATHECLARNRLQLHGLAVDAYLFSSKLDAPA